MHCQLSKIPFCYKDKVISILLGSSDGDYSLPALFESSRGLKKPSLWLFLVCCEVRLMSLVWKGFHQARWITCRIMLKQKASNSKKIEAGLSLRCRKALCPTSLLHAKSPF